MIDEATISGTMTRRHSSGVKTRARIILALASLPDGPTLRAIADAADCHWTTVDHHMPILQDDGLAVDRGDGWILTRAGQSTAAMLREFCRGA